LTKLADASNVAHARERSITVLCLSRNSRRFHKSNEVFQQENLSEKIFIDSKAYHTYAVWNFATAASF